MNENQAWPVGALYERNPTMDYSQAFDLAMAGWEAAGGPALAVMSSGVHAVEALKRWPGTLHLAGSGRFDAAEFAAQSAGWAWGPLTAIRLEAAPRTYDRLLWAEPEAPAAGALARALRELAAPGARLSVIASSGRRGWLPAWQTRPRPADTPLGPGAAGRALRAAGWRVEQQVALHGPRALAWTRLAQWAERLGRPDWGDRCLFAMRASYREPGWLWPLAPVALTLARPA